MKTVITAYITTGVAFLVVDAIWLTTMADMLYRPLLGDRLAPQFHLAPAVFFYVIYVAGIVFFAVLPAVESGSLGKAALNGAVLGLVAYATYDLTNQATLKDWPLVVTLADMVWGGFVTAVGASAGFLLASRVG
ncbi:MULTISPECIES: DUF2177 family protein [unclassified Rhizobium]|uniref:DUF2177 family protein n=1 Tax=unclassified Rhizobium TaxID=2613769 RepID=UPI0006F9BAAA|nr:MULTISPECIES: DUF2177 family protein [unclassified Rhizobium]KQV38020.1 hypothetical protein ASC86_07165 [Rhizobium sp. Root1212]KRD30678.1 hypothetical protein ASE37_07160 [Rhizobium sp. Root268]